MPCRVSLTNEILPSVPLPALLHHRVGIVVVDALEVFDRNAEGANSPNFPGSEGRIPDYIFDENRIVVGQLCDSFLVRPFEDAIKLATGGGFREADQLVRPQLGCAVHGKR